jgi:uncharacterized alpha/beta hydrolase family protein
MITLDKWYPMVYPAQYDVKSVSFEKAVERVQEEYKQALKANKIEKQTLELEVELYDKKARQNTIELGMFENRRRFQIFV